MPLDTVIFYIFAVVSTLYVIHFGLYLIGANLYDMWQFRRRYHYKRTAASRRNKKKPLVSVLVPAHNESLVLERCLESIRNSSYQKVQIVVIDDASTDRTYGIALDYKRKHPEYDISIVRRYKNVGKGSGLNYALLHRAQGDLVMTLDADSILERDTIENAVAYFDNPKIGGVAANVRIIEEHTILGMLQKFEHMIGYRSKKTYSLTKSEFVIGGVASTYRMDILREVGYYDTDTLTEDIGLSIKIIAQKGNRHNHIIYAADVTALTEGVATYKSLFRQRYRWKYGSLQNVFKYSHLMFSTDQQYTKRLTWYRLPMAILSEVVLLVTPLMWAYVVYLSFMTESLQLVVGAYLTVTAYTFITLWFDEHIKGWHRVRLSVYAPILYFCFYIMDVVQFVAVIRCIAKTHKLVRREANDSTWVSPERIGREVIAG